MMQTNFKQRYITIIIGIGQGLNGDQAATESTTYTIENHRVSVDIYAYGGETQGKAAVKIYGMSSTLMSVLTAIGPVLYALRAKNTIKILAGDDPNNLTLIYAGVIMSAYADYNNAPDVYLDIDARSAAVESIQQSIPFNASGKVTVDNIMKTLATRMGWDYLNLDVGPEFFLVDPVCDGSYWFQVQKFADAAKDATGLGIDAIQDCRSAKSVLKIKKQLSVFPSASMVVSPQTNMIGYPVYSQSYTYIKSLFLPDALTGSKLTVQGSFIQAANRDWNIITVVHELESILPNGKWQTTCGCLPTEIGTGTIL